jgi:hypothetical protein
LVRNIRLDLLVVIILALLSTATVLAWPEHTMSGALGLLLALALPGYALAAAAFPPGRLGLAEQLLLTFGLSLVLLVLAGLVLNTTEWGLQRRSWTVLLGGVTVAAALAAHAWIRTPVAPPGEQVARLHPQHVAMFGVAALLLALSFGVAFTAAGEQPAHRFTQLWALPAGSGEQPALRLGVRNGEGRALEYRVQVLGDGAPLGEWSGIHLAPDAHWTQTFGLTPAQRASRIEVLLYRQDFPGAVYRQVWLAAEAPPVLEGQ